MLVFYTCVGSIEATITASRCFSDTSLCISHQNLPSKDAVAALHHDGHGPVLEAAAARVPVQGSRQTKSREGQLAAAAKQLRALPAVSAPHLQRGRMFPPL